MGWELPSWWKADSSSTSHLPEAGCTACAASAPTQHPAPALAGGQWSAPRCATLCLEHKGPPASPAAGPSPSMPLPKPGIGRTLHLQGNCWPQAHADTLEAWNLQHLTENRVIHGMCSSPHLVLVSFTPFESHNLISSIPVTGLAYTFERQHNGCLLVQLMCPNALAHLCYAVQVNSSTTSQQHLHKVVNCRETMKTTTELSGSQQSFTVYIGHGQLITEGHHGFQVFRVAPGSGSNNSLLLLSQKRVVQLADSPSLGIPCAHHRKPDIQYITGEACIFRFWNREMQRLRETLHWIQGLTNWVAHYFHTWDFKTVFIFYPTCFCQSEKQTANGIKGMSHPAFQICDGGCSSLQQFWSKANKTRKIPW